ncbi:MAG: 4Fe-4S binding protein [Proteobacteria bacterium]|nr:4Fe-4S binding protein [Pseudomonadota bacterium]MBU1696005.1 4Fe-4S binding protein [Pseudomonadota bacterium]
MANLQVNIGGLELKNPFVVAASDIGCHIGQIREAEHYGAAAFIIKGCIPLSGAAGLTRKPRFRVDLKKGTLSAIAGFRRLGLEDAQRLILEAKKETRIPIGANIFVMRPTEEEKELVTKASRILFESGADFIELNTTGNLPVHFGETEETAKSGEYFLDETAANYPRFVYETIRSVKKVIDVPVMGKIAYENLNVPSLVKAMERAGADIIDIGNAGMGVMPSAINIYDTNKMGEEFVSADKNLALCLTGDPLRIIAEGYVMRSARSLGTPILGCGGIMNWKHAVEMIMCGASATAICTAFMIHGFGILKDMQKGLKKFMDESGYSSIEDFKGVFLDKFALTPSEITVLDAVASIAAEKCNGCGLCTKPAHCGLERRAISLVGGKAIIDDESQCLGCETCASVCPVDAITMILKKEK